MHYITVILRSYLTLSIRVTSEVALCFYHINHISRQRRQERKKECYSYIRAIKVMRISVEHSCRRNAIVY